MRFEMSRHLGGLIKPGPAKFRKFDPAIFPEFDSYELVVYLLHLDAQIEHSLMVQYLYAAYSLGGPKTPPSMRDTVQKWQNTILGIAKEEMGHLITVQNVLRLIGAPLNFSREDYPSESQSDLGPYSLEPLSLESLKSYVWVESPADWPPRNDAKLQKEFASFINAPAGPKFKVADLFNALIGNIGALPLELFQADSRPFQASFDEWGRGYENGERGNPSRQAEDFPKSPSLIVRQMASRNDAVAALQEISHQGEDGQDAATGPNDATPVSHFARFYTIYREFKDAIQKFHQVGQRFEPCRNVVENPYVAASAKIERMNLCQHDQFHEIKNPVAQLWGHLFNVRYRMVLNYLTHSFEIVKPFDDAVGPTPRGLIISATFGEMYNMRALAKILMETPIAKKSKVCAGPPFQMPYSLGRPMGDRNRWLQHKRNLTAAALLIDLLEKEQLSPTSRTYLSSLRKSDQNLLNSIEKILR